MAPPPAFDTLTIADIARLADDDRLPPVERWHPDHCGPSDMRIARDGTWYHQGTPITRPAMVRLFSTILRRDPERFVLVTPVECVGIQVEDAPFLAVDVECRGSGREQTLDLVTNVGDRVAVDAEHPLRFAEQDDQPAPSTMTTGAGATLRTRSDCRSELQSHVSHDPWFPWRSGARTRSRAVSAPACSPSHPG